MKVIVIKGPFDDYKDKKRRNVGDEFICSKDRFKEINDVLKSKTKKGPWIEEVKEK